MLKWYLNYYRLIFKYWPKILEIKLQIKIPKNGSKVRESVGKSYQFGLTKKKASLNFKSKIHSARCIL